ncbi:hypothetical protein AAFF_G00291200 [Aldrovandia affinis]|uniref:Secreted protein n=1 Tax=Aldrovandia affinis TaxID=143900 RepID=A0AAD7R9K0_9TELE|nr:hypothetical protein AAFF_G00291200 [Aldrovandia affinis]
MPRTGPISTYTSVLALLMTALPQGRRNEHYKCVIIRDSALHSGAITASAQVSDVSAAVGQTSCRCTRNRHAAGRRGKRDGGLLRGKHRGEVTERQTNLG